VDVASYDDYGVLVEARRSVARGGEALSEMVCYYQSVSLLLCYTRSIRNPRRSTTLACIIGHGKDGN
jgi:hypothetical protein